MNKYSGEMVVVKPDVHPSCFWRVFKNKFSTPTALTSPPEMNTVRSATSLGSDLGELWPKAKEHIGADTEREVMRI